MKQPTRLRSFLLRGLIVCTLIAVLLPLTSRTSAAEGWQTRFYPETGQNVAGPFLNYFDANGGLARFGYPLTPVRWDGQYQVQFFERQRFEYHPDKAGTPFETELSRLGALLTTGRNFPAGAQQNVQNNRWFPETSHNLQGVFLNYWQNQGGLAMYGLPISEAFQEKSSTDGKTYTVQYFERARFEYHPENQAPFDVLLGRLGYDYLLKIDGKAPSVAAAAAPASATPAQNPVAQQPAQASARTVAPSAFQGGINLTGWWSGAYTSGDASGAVEQLAKDGTNWVALLTTWYQNGANASGMAPDNQKTPTDDSLRWAIRTAHGRGLKVSLKPHVDSYDNTWRGNFKPADLNSWFASYKTMIMHYTQLAAEEKVEQLVIGTELYSINTDQDSSGYWRPLIASVRSIYSGSLTYGANWSKQKPEFNAITWWDALDYIGVDAYYPLSTKSSPSLDDLKNGWASYTDSYGQTYHWVADITAAQAKWNKPVLFVEIGYNSNPAGAAVYDQPQNNWADLQLQVRAYEAMFEVWSAQPWWSGVYPWNWEIPAGSGGANDPNMALNNKPAMNVISSWYAKLDSR